jgi:misacylated tRNA(Ala) deacylase
MIKFYEENSYKKEFETKIINLDEENNFIELENTAFYGKGGGQPGDTGWLFIKKNSEDNRRVLETLKKEDSLMHQVDSIDNLKIGDAIKGKINWENRYKYMKMHTALHLLCAVIPMGVTGGQIGILKSRLDFNVDGELINKEEVQESLNQILKINNKVSYEWVDSIELEKKPELVRTMSVKPPKTNGKIRLVKIGNIDLQPCGGTHVKETSEIGSIIIGKIENKGRMNRRVNISLSD